MQTISNKRLRLQQLIDMFEHQADSYILRQDFSDDADVPPLNDYDQYDHVDNPDDAPGMGKAGARSTLSDAISRTSDGSGMDIINPEDHPIILPSSLGWDWCVSHGLQPLAVKEAKLRCAQANGSIHHIRLALGFKSALFRTHVRTAKTQQTKTRAWNAIHSVDTTVHEHARIYSMARDLFRNIHDAYATGPDLPQLHTKDLNVETLVLGSEKAGQCNKQLSWIWSFGHTVNSKGTWMDDCEWSFACLPCPCFHISHMAVERVHWLRAKAQFERWVEEQDSIYNEATWIPAYFHTKSEVWRKLMVFALHSSLKGHASYASYQMQAWEELSRSAVKALSLIMDTPVKRFKV
jgi:hypothetical protein